MTNRTDFRFGPLEAALTFLILVILVAYGISHVGCGSASGTHHRKVAPTDIVWLSWHGIPYTPRSTRTLAWLGESQAKHYTAYQKRHGLGSRAITIVYVRSAADLTGLYVGHKHRGHSTWAIHQGGFWCPDDDALHVLAGWRDETPNLLHWATHANFGDEQHASLPGLGRPLQAGPPSGVDWISVDADDFDVSFALVRTR